MPIKELCGKLIDLQNENLNSNKNGQLIMEFEENYMNHIFYNDSESRTPYSISGISFLELNKMNIDLALSIIKELYKEISKEKLISLVMWEFTYYGIPDKEIMKKYDLPEFGSNLIEIDLKELDMNERFCCDICNDEIDNSQKWYWKLLESNATEKAFDVCINCYESYESKDILINGTISDRVKLECEHPISL
jgi:hypothetical protein